MNLRIQTFGQPTSTNLRCFFPVLTAGVDDVSVFEVLRKGLSDLADLCDVVEDKFTTARDNFNAANPDRVEHR